MDSNTHKRYAYLKGKDFDDVPDHLVQPKALWHGFEENTSGHGLGRIHKSTGIVKKVTWILICVGGFAAWGIHTTTLLVNYFHYPVDIAVHVQTATNLRFPAVTICNLNPMRASLFSSVVNTSLLRESAEDSVHDLGKQADKSTVNVLFTAMLKEVVSYLDYPTKSSVGHQYKDFILECTFNNNACNIRYVSCNQPQDMSFVVGYKTVFTWSIYYSLVWAFFNERYGNCYSISIPESDSMKVRSTGPDHGLTLTLNIEQDEYLPFTQSAGVRMTIHNQSVMPFPTDDGINLEPGKLTMIGMRQVQISRLPLPYGVCTEPTEPDPTRNLYEVLNSTVKYSQSACLKSCYQQKAISICKCFDTDYPRPENLSATVKSCRSTSSDDKNIRCMWHLQYDLKDGVVTCDCPLPCSESQHALTISTSTWPSDAYKNTMLSQLELLNNSAVNSILNHTDPDMYRRNFLEVTVYFEDLNYEEITEKPGYEGHSLIADLGGSIGLWIGWSILTLAELLEFLSDLIVMSCTRIGRKRRTETISQIRDGSHITTSNIL